MREWIVAMACAACVLLELVHPVLTREHLRWHDPNLDLLESAGIGAPAAGAASDFHFAGESDDTPSLALWLRGADGSLLRSNGVEDTRLRRHTLTATHATRASGASDRAAQTARRATAVRPRCLNRQSPERC